MSMDRRFFLGGSLALGASACIPPDQSPLGRLAAELRIIEAAAGGTLGCSNNMLNLNSTIDLNFKQFFRWWKKEQTIIAAEEGRNS